MAEEAATEQVLKISVYTPLVYVVVMALAFAVFSILYRQHRLRKLVAVEPLFGHNHTVDLYHIVKDKYYDKLVPKDEKPPEKAVKAALLRRGVEAIRRSLKLKENEPVFNRLYQDGLIGDDVFQGYVLQNKVQQAELKEVVEECLQFSKEWPAAFFPVAQEICYNEALRRRLQALDLRGEALSEIWQYHVEKIDASAK